ncbi:TetR family transcription regulator [Natronomonas pharaonis DSM 2160]|uniref:TetR family transcription regulator n=1 Tax=Natronomonas pharaonis (strain ATCC 35678 / DSM 2160 / CIP 103997 / JCM 8858 / NBRC 14720 / NCIMB 2260 / Gabara) TaxID=348780 RepID=A0A1U7EW59_NATPD|nr:TetR/AcrR family transcriptional regulator [Natronomonas pharaonis]CAI49324.1 TetR family transcription regulator [Natronomonas pharaonis DSM 2160]
MKGFTDEERDRIERELREAGRELFASFGLERTRISDITDEVGIGTSTFYQFYDSKAELYLDVIYEEVTQIGDDVADEIADAESLEEEIRRTLTLLFRKLETNDILYQVLVEDDGQRLRNQLDADVQKRHHENKYRTLGPLVERWTENERFRADDPEVALDMLGAVPQFVAHRRQFDALDRNDAYEPARELLVETLTDGLVLE